MQCLFAQLNYFNQYIQRIVKEMIRNGTKRNTTTVLYIAIEYINSYS